MEINQAKRIINRFFDVMPTGRFGGLYPLNTVSALPDTKENVKGAFGLLINFYRKEGTLSATKEYRLIKAYVSLASFVSDKDFDIVEKTKLKLGHLYTDTNEEVLAWFSEPRNRKMHERSYAISQKVMLEANKLKGEIESLLKN